MGVEIYFCKQCHECVHGDFFSQCHICANSFGLCNTCATKIDGINIKISDGNEPQLGEIIDENKYHLCNTCFEKYCDLYEPLLCDKFGCNKKGEMFLEYHSFCIDHGPQLKKIIDDFINNI